MIDLEPCHLELVIRLLRERIPAGYEVRAYGSRVTGGARRFSDLDLAVVGQNPLDSKTLESLKDAFSESDLPILVDIRDWATVSPGFREMVGNRFEVIQL